MKRFLTINVNRNNSFAESLHGRGLKVSSENLIAAKVTSFDLCADVYFDSFTRPGELITAVERQKRLEESGAVPLDYHCARSIFEHPNALWELSLKHSSERGGIGCPSMYCADFCGTIFTNDFKQAPLHILSFAYPPMGGVPTSPIFFEMYDYGWDQNSPCVLFTKEFIKKVA